MEEQYTVSMQRCLVCIIVVILWNANYVTDKLW